MGTRHLTCVVKDKEYIVAQYGQWDGYPSGQGVNILHFLRNEFIEEKFLEKIKMAIFPTQEELQNCYKKHGADNDEWISLEVAKSFNLEHPYLSRDIGSDILPMIQNAEKPFWFHKNKNFAYQSLFCEWCYVIDLDEKSFEIFTGFNLIKNF